MAPMRIACLLVALLFVGCDASEPEPRTLTFADVTAPPTQAEVSAVVADWDRRDTRAEGVRVEATETVTLGTVPMEATVYSHLVGGVRHVGAVLVPTALTTPASAPVMVYAHGAYAGPGGFPFFPIESLAERVPGEPLRSQFVYVVPAYRSERIQLAGTTYTAEGSASIGDYDVDDTMALLSVALDRVPQADPSRVALFGESRGGLVVLEMAARDSRVDLVVDAFGLTDYRIGLAGITEEVFLGSVRQALAAPNAPESILTGSIVPLDAITEEPDGTLTISGDGYRRLRQGLARTAPVAYVERLPITQVHHGTADATATVEFSRVLAQAFEDAGRPSGSSTFTYYEYDGGGHDLSTLPGFYSRFSAVLSETFDL